MFATVLKEITGYFDRRALLSTFLPTLVAAGSLVLAAVLASQDAKVVAHTWGGLPGTVQAVAIAGFLVAVALWSFALANLRPLLDQLFQGRWGNSVSAAALVRRRTARLRTERTCDSTEDERLERIEAALLTAAESLPRPGGPVRPFPGDPTAELSDAETAWSSAAPLSADAAADVLPGLSIRLADLAGSGDPVLDDPRFPRLVAFATELTERRLQDVRSRRASVQQRLFVLYPADPVEVAPTRIGNILLAAEQHPRLRYGLDPVVVWSRLQPLLPDAFAASLKDAKAALDLMLTLTVYLPAVGAPIALLAAVNARLDGNALAWATFIAALLTGAALPRLGRPRPAAAVSVLVLAIPALLASLTGPPTGLASSLLRTAVAVTLLAGLAGLTSIVHAGAREAALAFSDQLKSAFDLHRRRVLQEFGLAFPADLAAERALWLDLCQFLYRGDQPVSAAFRYRDDPPPDP
ncbi:hypothetical protein [Streptomyces sp. NRRL S-646]|uniref:hypothetical protein n=1 Tax=Streptomyces sp. NRRL S-646 TaxID=1463917 RepID=UPI0004C4991D|nr:hypothetical protein [Streptomyces sp. NRRL S-646]